MDLRLSPAEVAFRDEVRAFLDAELTPELRRATRLTPAVFAEQDVAMQWQLALERKGWLVYFYPESAGGPGWTPVQRYIFEKECARAGAPHIPGMGLRLVGPVIYTFGTEAQKQRYLGPLRRGEHVWGQGFSEPGSGSDLASIKTRAVRQGGEYVVNGSKIWTTYAQHANKLFCLVRTDLEVKPQRGISFLLIDMDQPGVKVRPIISASGEHEVNEVFLDDVRVPLDDLVGEEGQGWTIAKFLLENERGGFCYAPDLLADLDHIRAAAEGLGLAGDPLFKDRFARIVATAEALEMTELRLLEAIQSGEAPGPMSVATKLIGSETRQEVERLASELYGVDGLQLPTERPFHDAAAMPPAIGGEAARISGARYLNSRAWTIFGGTSEIQLGLIARTALGL